MNPLMSNRNMTLRTALPSAHLPTGHSLSLWCFLSDSPLASSLLHLYTHICISLPPCPFPICLPLSPFLLLRLGTLIFFFLVLSPFLFSFSLPFLSLFTPSSRARGKKKLELLVVFSHSPVLLTPCAEYFVTIHTYICSYIVKIMILSMFNVHVFRVP